jgi:hypothetical protein
MTPQEHELLKLKIQSIAQDALIKWLADLWRGRLAVTSEPERSMTLAAMEAKLRSGALEYSTLTMPWLDAASSDMQASLFQEAYEEISKKILGIVEAGLTPEEEARLRAALPGGTDRQT